MTQDTHDTDRDDDQDGATDTALNNATPDAPESHPTPNASDTRDRRGTPGPATRTRDGTATRADGGTDADGDSSDASDSSDSGEVAARRRVARTVYDHDVVRDAALDASWTRDLFNPNAPDPPEGSDEWRVGEWRVIAESSPVGVTGTWQVRRVPTAPSAPELHAVTVQHDNDDSDVSVWRVGVLTLVPHGLDADRLDATLTGGDALTDDELDAVQRAYKKRAAALFWEHPDRVVLVRGDAYITEPRPEAIREVFSDAAGVELSDAQVESLRRSQRAARPKGKGIGGDDYRISLEFDAVPAFELLAVRAAGQDAAAPAREAARRDVLRAAGVPERAARDVTGADRSVPRDAGESQGESRDE